MPKYGPLSSPYDSPSCPTPSGGDSSQGGTTGGFDLTDGRKETPNMSEIPLQPTTVAVPDGPGQNESIKVDGLVTAPGVPFGGFGK